MNTLFFILLTLILFVLQTLILPSFLWFPQCFDLLIIAVLSISLIAKSYLALLSIILIGAIMDSSSGVPFFIHIFSYLWIYIIVQLVKQLLFARSIVFVLVTSIISVAIQQIFILFSIFIQQGADAVLAMNYALLISQLFWGFLLIGPGIWLVNICRMNFLAATTMFKKQVIRKYRGEL